MRSPVKWVERSKTRTRTDGQRPRTALRRPAIQCSGGIAVHPPARIPGRLTSGGLVGSARIAPSDSLRPAVWPVYPTPADKPPPCLDHFRMPTDMRELLAIVRQSLAGVRTALFPRPAVLRLLPTRETLAQRHARWPCRISLRDGAQRDRAYMTGGLHTFARTRQRRRGCAQ